MIERCGAILLVLALAAPAYAQPTTTTVTPTTSTTFVIPACVRTPMLCRVSGRLEDLRDIVSEAWVSGDFPVDAIVFRLQRTSICLGRARRLCNGSRAFDVSRARAKLRQCVRPLTIALAKARSNHGRTVIPPDLAATFVSEAEGLVSDIEAARDSLTCPRDPAVGSTD